MIKYKDLETIFRNEEVSKQFSETKNLFQNRFKDEDYNFKYKQARKKLRIMIASEN